MEIINILARIRATVENTVLASLSNKKAKLMPLMSAYPPYLGSGIWVEHCESDFREITVSMKLYPWNRNYVGTHFGGSLFAMCDPFYMLMLIENLGANYIVWDKSASVVFKKPGRGTVKARFTLSDEQISKIKEEVKQKGRSYPEFEIEILNEQNELVAAVKKVLSVKPKAH